MIPSLSESGVLPPFDPAKNAIDVSAMAPYRTTLLEVAKRFATTPPRVAILKGLIAYRAELRAAGIAIGFQWIDGSFVEDVERNRQRPPEDIDVITFAERPNNTVDLPDWIEFVNDRPNLFDPGITKNMYRCDAYYVDLALPPMILVSSSRYWFGLFSHQRETFLWKGLLEVPLQDDDIEAIRYLNQGGSHAS